MTTSYRIHEVKVVDNELCLKITMLRPDEVLSAPFWISVGVDKGSDPIGRLNDKIQGFLQDFEQEVPLGTTKV